MNYIICAVEIGWRGVREYSIIKAAEGKFVENLIKGLLQKEVLNAITKYELIKLIPTKQIFFRAFLFIRVLRAKLFNNLETVVVTKKRTFNWINKLGRLLKFNTRLLVESDPGYRLYNLNEKK